MSSDGKDTTMSNSKSQQSSPTQFVGVQKTSRCSIFLSHRFGIILLTTLFATLFIASSQNLPYAIICMSDTPSDEGDQNGDARSGNATDSDLAAHRVGNVSFLGNASQHVTNETLTESKEFSWDSTTVGIVLSSGRFASPLGGFIAPYLYHKFPQSFVIAGLTVCVACSMFLSPIAVRFHLYLFIALRVFLGFFPSIAVGESLQILAWWSPQHELELFVSLVRSGNIFAQTFGSLTSGYLCKVPVDNGWPFMFYLSGTAFVVWLIVWLVWGSAKPESNRLLSEKEKAYILKHRAGISAGKKPKLPLKLILTSLPALGFILCQALDLWLGVILGQAVPLFLDKVLEFPIETNGTIVMVGYFIRLAGSFLWVAVYKALINKLMISTTLKRKCIFTIGYSVAIMAVLGAGFMTKSTRWYAVALIFAALFGWGVIPVSLECAALDIAPRYAGTMVAMGLATGQIVAIFSGLLIAIMTPNNAHDEWRNVFIVIAGSFAAMMLVFNVMVKCELQSWANPQQDTPQGNGIGKDDNISFSEIESPAIGDSSPSPSSYIQDIMQPDRSPRNSSLGGIDNIGYTGGEEDKPTVILDNTRL